MHKRFLPLLLAATFYSNAQESAPASVESSVFGVQAGLVGFWAQHELKLSTQIALRSEIGTELMTVTYSNDEDESVLAPVISVEPKWYYNLGKRVNKGRNIKGNSGNYFSVKANYNPDWFVIGQSHDLKLNHLAVLPKWGIRRIYGKHFTFETGIGVGPQFYVGSSNRWKKDTEVYIDALVRIGYTF